jgi:hypothetical protein
MREMQTRVVDLTVELTGETKTYTVPESQNVAKAMGITLSTSIDPIMNELNAIKKHQSRHNKQRRCPSCQDRGL